MVIRTTASDSLIFTDTSPLQDGHPLAEYLKSLKNKPWEALTEEALQQATPFLGRWTAKIGVDEEETRKLYGRTYELNRGIFLTHPIVLPHNLLASIPDGFLRKNDMHLTSGSNAFAGYKNQFGIIRIKRKYTDDSPAAVAVGFFSVDDRIMDTINRYGQQSIYSDLLQSVAQMQHEPLHQMTPSLRNPYLLGEGSLLHDKKLEGKIPIAQWYEDSTPVEYWATLTPRTLMTPEGVEEADRITRHYFAQVRELQSKIRADGSASVAQNMGEALASMYLVTAQSRFAADSEAMGHVMKEIDTLDIARPAHPLPEICARFESYPPPPLVPLDEKITFFAKAIEELGINGNDRRLPKFMTAISGIAKMNPAEVAASLRALECHKGQVKIRDKFGVTYSTPSFEPIFSPAGINQQPSAQLESVCQDYLALAHKHAADIHTLAGLPDKDEFFDKLLNAGCMEPLKEIYDFTTRSVRDITPSAWVRFKTAVETTGFYEGVSQAELMDVNATSRGALKSLKETVDFMDGQKSAQR